jgi:hypothetical protein
MRVVSLLASGTEIVCALDAGRALVCRSHECDNPAWVSSLPACTRRRSTWKFRAATSTPRCAGGSRRRGRREPGAIRTGVFLAVRTE